MHISAIYENQFKKDLHNFHEFDAVLKLRHLIGPVASDVSPDFSAGLSLVVNSIYSNISDFTCAPGEYLRLLINSLLNVLKTDSATALSQKYHACLCSGLIDCLCIKRAKSSLPN